MDGPSHYARASRIALGSTEMKRRQLKAVGYRLCSVAFWQWPSGSSTEDKEHVLRSVLAPHVKVLALPAKASALLAPPLVLLLLRGRVSECVCVCAGAASETSCARAGDAAAAAQSLVGPPASRDGGASRG